MRLVLASLASALALVACSSGGPPEEVAPTRWEADLETAVWGPAQSGQAFDEDGVWRIDLIASSEGGLVFKEWARTVGGSDTSFAECPATLGEDAESPYVVAVNCDGMDAFEIEIAGDTLTYEREADIGTISGTFNRGVLPGD